MKPATTHPSCYHTGYALTCAEYDSLLTRAKGRCELCKLPTGRPAIEHDHTLGNWAVRGLVCQPCNNRLRYIDAGKFVADSQDRAYLAAAWHLTVDTTAKQGRVRKRRACGTCGHDCAIQTDGSVYKHWSRLPGMLDAICAG